MAQYALVATDTNEVLKIAKASRFRKGTPPVFHNKPFRWLPLEKVARPDFDAETQHRPRRTRRVEATRVVDDWIAPVDKTPREIRDEKLAGAPPQKDIAYLFWFDTTNEIRKLRGEAEFTKPQFRKYLESLIDAASQ